MLKQLLFLTLIAVVPAVSNAEYSTTRKLTVSGAIGIAGAASYLAAAFAVMCLVQIEKALEQEYFQQWIQENNLNSYGDPIGTVYEEGTPLALRQDNWTYIQEKFPEKPWFQKHEKIQEKLGNLGGGLVCSAGAGFIAFILAITSDSPFSYNKLIEKTYV